MSGTLLGLLILHNFHFQETLLALGLLFYKLLSEAWILKTLGFVLLVGSIMELISRSGGINGFIEFALHQKSFVKSKRSALMLSYIIGLVIFIESSITSLIAGAVGKPFCNTFKIPQAKLALVCDSTSAPIGSLIIVNGYGALLLGLISTQISQYVLDVNALELLLSSVLYNFYAMSALVVTFLFIWFDFDIGAMRSAQYKHSKTNAFHKHGNMYLMILPIVFMLLFIFVFLYITGDGEILKGSGSSSIFYTMITVLLFTFFYYVGTKTMRAKEWVQSSFRGARKLFSISLILIFAFSIGDVTSQLHTGLYLSSLLDGTINPLYLASIIFLLSSVISFSTGTSWGTFSIMIPIAVPMALQMDASLALCIGAVISGGIFGDHCSPISDTTIISSMAADCEVIEHVKTQLPYALISAFIALILFTLFSLPTQ